MDQIVTEGTVSFGSLTKEDILKHSNQEVEEMKVLMLNGSLMKRDVPTQRSWRWRENLRKQGFRREIMHVGGDLGSRPHGLRPVPSWEDAFGGWATRSMRGSGDEGSLQGLIVTPGALCVCGRRRHLLFPDRFFLFRRRICCP